MSLRSILPIKDTKMNAKDNYINDSSLSKMLHDENYYKHIFKKTEKIVTVVFYILHNIDSDKKSETHISNIASKAHLVHEHALRSLDVRKSSAREVLEQFAQSLIALDSTFRVAVATRLVSPDVFTVVVDEVDVVMRGLRSYIATDHNAQVAVAEGLASLTSTPVKPKRSPTNAASPAAIAAAPQAPAVPTMNDRRERIKTILGAKGEASIKDIAEIVTDCSEKTLQRELNAMIKDNVVKREGERRWSRYSLF